MGNVVAGASLGGLLGLIVGMSASPVTSIVVSALTALLGGVVSVTPNDSLTFHPVRLASFGVAAITALLCGLLLRTYNVLAPSTSHYVKELTTAGLPADRALPLAIRLRFGVTEQGEASPPAAASRSDSVFFSDEADMRCSNTARNEYQSGDLWLDELGRRGFGPLLDATRGLRPDERERVLLAGRRLLCE